MNINKVIKKNHFPLRRRHRHYSAGDTLMIRYLLLLFLLFCLFSCAADSPLCLVKGTKILTPEGLKLIENLSVEDEIISYNGTNKIINQITAIKKYQTKQTLKITLKNGTEIEGTKDHPFFDVEKQSYVKLDKLKTGDSLQLTNGGSSKISLIEKKTYPKKITVYDLSVKFPYHNYFAEEVLVHNKTLAPPTPPAITLIITLNDGSKRTNVIYDYGFRDGDVGFFSNNANLQNFDSGNATLNLSNANLSNANLSNASLTANLQAANLQAANLQAANLKNANLKNANLQSANLRNAFARYGNLSEANLNNANLINSRLESINLSNADLINANLSNANLTAFFRLDRANLKFVNLTGANLIDANLDRADLMNANLSRANLSNAILHNTLTNGIILTGAVGITSNTFLGAP